MKKIAVIGSMNIDIVSKVEDLPKKGETIHTIDFFKTFGGKGGNQAIALGKLDSDISMFGKVGNDEFGDMYIKKFSDNNVKTNSIEKDGNNTGTAIVTVDNFGSNNITLASEANYLVDNKYIDKYIDILATMDIILFQLEIPINTTEHALKSIKNINKKIITVLDPAPAMKIQEDIFQYVDYITPNETETKKLTNIQINESYDSIYKAASILKDNGVKNVVIKAGKYGAYLFNDSGLIFAPSYDVKTMDTTAAGDSFNAGLAKGLSVGMSNANSMLLACSVASLATTGLGAQTSMPTYKEALELMESQNNIKIKHF